MKEKFQMEWNKITNGFTWEAMMQTLLLFIDPETRVYTRPGKDWGIDAFSGDGLTVYQAKFHIDTDIEKAITDVKNEFVKIKKYREKKDFWKPVINWVLFTNLDKNPNDEQKWNEAITQIDSDGITISLWDWGIIQQKLIEHREVYTSYFENEVRIFTTMAEEVGRQRRYSWFADALDVDFVGRDDALAKLSEFMLSPKQVWAVSGPGGMGKTHFLLECARQIDTEWNVLWATRESLTSPHLYDSIVPERKTLLLIDELVDVHLLTQILLIELSIGRMKDWKVIFTERVTIAPTIRELDLTKYDDIRFPQYVLPKLNDIDREKLIKSLLLNIDQEKHDISFHDIDGIVDRISSISNGIPLWIGLSVRLLIKEKSFENLPKRAEGLIRAYSEEILTNLDTISIPKEKYSDIRQWVALYGKVNLQDSDLIKFIAKTNEIKKTEFKALIDLMEDCGLVIRTGANRRFASIAPDTIRDSILMDSLIDEDEITPFAESVIEGLLKETLPSRQLILENLSRIEYIQSAYSEEIVPLLDPILARVLEQTKTGTTQEQLNAIGLIDTIQYARPAESLDILKSCWSHEHPEFTDSSGIFGPVTYNHKSVLDKIPWELFGLSHFCTDIELQREVLNFYQTIITYEIERGVDVGDKSESSQALFSRMLFGEEWSENYLDLVCRETDLLLEKVGMSESLSSLEFLYLDIYLSGLICAEKHYHSWGSRGTFRWGRLEICPLDRQWIVIEKYHRKVKALMINPLVPVDMLLKFTKHYSRLFREVNLSTKSDNEIEDPRTKAGNKFFLEEFLWIKCFLESEENGQNPEVRHILREDTWHWHLEYSQNEEVKAMAKECEDTYFIQSKDQMIFEYIHGYQENWQEKREQFYNQHIRGKSAEDIYSFLEKIDSYHCTESTYKISVMGSILGDELDSEKQYLLFRDTLLLAEVETFRWDFGVALIKSYHAKLRSKDIEMAQEDLRKCLDISSSKGNFLWQYYSSITSLGNADKEDFDILVYNQMEIDNSHLYVKLLALMTYALGDVIFNIVDEQWPSMDNSFQMLYLQGLIDDYSISRERIALFWSDERKEWFLKKVIRMEEIDWLGGVYYHLKKRVVMKGMKNVQWYLYAMKERIANVKDNKNLYSIHFSLTFFVTPDFSMQEEVDAFAEIIRFVLTDYPLNYHISYIKELDPENEVLSKLVRKIFNATDSAEEKWRLARIAGEYRRNSSAWDEISRVICEYAMTCDSNTRSDFYGAINWNGITSYSSGYGQVAKVYYDNLKEAQEALKNDTCESRKEYWQKELDKATAMLKSEEEEAKEQRGE